MLEVIGGLVLGVAIMLAKDKFMLNDKKQKDASNKKEHDELYAENEKFRRRNKEMERQIEDLLADIRRLHRQSNDKNNEQDEVRSELLSKDNEIKKLRVQNNDLLRIVDEYKKAYQVYELEKKS